MKTIEDILKEMRKPKSNCPKDERYEVAYSVADLESVLKNFADQIDTAVKYQFREVTKTIPAHLREATKKEEVVVAKMQTTTPTCEKSSQVGNAAKCKELLGEVYDLLDKSKSYINDIESTDRKREFSHYLTRAKNLVDNIINQELSANVSVGNMAAMREVLEEFVKYSELVQQMGIFVRDSLVKITTKAREAIAKPPRNCDMYNAADEFMEDFADSALLDEWKKYRESNFTTPLQEGFHCIEWLFAEAKGEKK